MSRYYDGDRVQDGPLYTSYSGDDLKPRRSLWQIIREALSAQKGPRDA